MDVVYLIWAKTFCSITSIHPMILAPQPASDLAWLLLFPYESRSGVSSSLKALLEPTLGQERRPFITTYFMQEVRKKNSNQSQVTFTPNLDPYILFFLFIIDSSTSWSLAPQPPQPPDRASLSLSLLFPYELGAVLHYWIHKRSKFIKHREWRPLITT